MRGRARVALFWLLLVLVPGCTDIRIGPPRPPAFEPPVVCSERTEIEAAQKHAEELLLAGDFARLETLANQMLASRELFPNGTPHLELLYQGVKEPPDQDWPSHLSRLQRWIKAHPGSATARIALGGSLVSYAWEARGSGYADTVTEQGWSLFKDRLEQAETLLREGEALSGGKDPLAHTNLLTVGKGLGWDPAQSDRLVEQGLQAWPNCTSLLRVRANGLLPRWGGRPDSLKNFARGRPEETLAILYSSVMKLDLEGEVSLNWEADLKPSFAAYLRHYPSEINLNRYAYAAYLHEDWPELRALFIRLGPHYDPAFWSPERFNEIRTWAFSQT